MTSKAMRLNDELVRAAEDEARLMHRTLPKQIEYWASLGRALGRVLNAEDLLKVQVGLAELKLQAKEAGPVSLEDAMSRLDALRSGGGLANAVSKAAVQYEASGEPGVLIRIQGSRWEQGRFEGGKFVVLEAQV